MKKASTFELLKTPFFAIKCFRDKRTVNVYTADGRQIAARTAGTEATVIAVEPGLYVVRIGETSFKCIVK